MSISQAQIAAWKARNWADALAYRHAIRARNIAGHWNGTFSGKQWRALLKLWGYRCCYCGRKLPAGELQPEHLVPLAAGGRNAISNLAPACATCNSMKGKKPWREFILWLLAQDIGVDIERFLSITDAYADIRTAA